MYEWIPTNLSSLLCHSQTFLQKHIMRCAWICRTQEFPVATATKTKEERDCFRRFLRVNLGCKIHVYTYICMGKHKSNVSCLLSYTGELPIFVRKEQRTQEQKRKIYLSLMSFSVFPQIWAAHIWCFICSMHKSWSPKLPLCEQERTFFLLDLCVTSCNSCGTIWSALRNIHDIDDRSVWTHPTFSQGLKGTEILNMLSLLHLSAFVYLLIFSVCVSLSLYINPSILSTNTASPQPQELTDILEISNMVFTSLFSLEMLLKLLALGLFGYIKNPYNSFDSIIVIIRWGKRLFVCLPQNGNSVIESSSYHWEILLILAAQLCSCCHIDADWSSWAKWLHSWSKRPVFTPLCSSTG